MLSSSNPSMLNMTWPLTKEQQLLVNVLLRFWVVALRWNKNFVSSLNPAWRWAVLFFFYPLSIVCPFKDLS